MTTTWKRAVCLVVLGKAEVLDVYDKVLHSAFGSFGCPCVVRIIVANSKIQFNKLISRRKRVEFSKRHVFYRDRQQCGYCQKRFPIGELTCDHILPRSRGGKTCWENMVTACQDCNVRKANMTPEEAGMTLFITPKAPEWVHGFIEDYTKIPEQWKPYCYWI